MKVGYNEAEKRKAKKREEEVKKQKPKWKRY